MINVFICGNKPRRNMTGNAKRNAAKTEKMSLIKFDEKKDNEIQS